MAQIQCPNCGGYKTSQEIVAIDPKTGNTMSGTGWGGCVMALTIGIIIFIIIALILSAIAGALNLNIEDNPITPICTVSLGMFVGTVSFMMWFSRLSQGVNRGYTRYTCNLCGFQWDDRHPTPKVNIRPDLIALGEKRLEEERRAKEEEIERAMAMKWLDDHRKE